MPSRLLRTGPAPLLTDDGSLSVGGRSLPLQVVPHSRARRLTLRIARGGTAIRVTAPVSVGEKQIVDFIERHRGWIERRIDTYPEERRPRHGGTLSYLGRTHRIEWSGRARGTVDRETMDDGSFRFLVHGEETHLPRRIADYIKKQAREHLTERTEFYCEAVGKPYRSIKLKDTSSRWGSCSARGTLSYSWRIMMAPPGVVDYLVAHEVAHLVHFNHSRHFWGLVREICPELDEGKHWLRRHGEGLLAVDFGC